MDIRFIYPCKFIERKGIISNTLGEKNGIRVSSFVIKEQT